MWESNIKVINLSTALTLAVTLPKPSDGFGAVFRWFFAPKKLVRPTLNHSESSSDF